MAKALLAVALLALLACAVAQNADDARELGEPGSNYCEPLCKEAISRNKNYEKMESFCKSECNKCVDAVAKTTPGQQEALPAPCQTAYKFKEIPQIIADFKAGKISASKSG